MVSSMKKLSLMFTIILLAACQQNSGQKVVDLSNRKSSLRRIAENVKRSGDLQAAAQLEAQIIEMDQNDAGSFIALANSVKQYGSDADVIEILETGEELNPTNSDLKVELAKVYLKDSNPDLALVKLGEVTGEKSRDFYNAKGVALDLNGDYEAAQKTYAAGLRENQRDSLLLNNLALSKLLSREYDSAIPILKELAARNSDSKYANNLALAYGMKGDTKAARKILGRDLSKEEIDANLKIYKELR